MYFGGLPPEVNSGLMYAGSGAGPLLAAASSWDGVGAELHSAAAGYNSVVAGLTSEGWMGPASTAMATAAAPYAAWLSATAAQAEQTAVQLRAAVAAYEAAHAATVPPPVIAANRTQLATLIATNILGQNAPAIAATEALYLEMWAQDVAAMFGYQASAKPASVLTPFSRAKQSANPNGPLQQLGAVANAAGNSAGTHVQAAAAAVPPGSGELGELGELAGLTNAKDAVGWATVLPQNGSYVFSLANSLNSLARAFAPAAAAAAGVNTVSAVAPALGAVAPAAAGVGGLSGMGVLTGALGQSGTIGGLSVPQAWAAASPVTGTTGATLVSATSALGATPAAGAAGHGMLGGLPMLANALRGADGHNAALPRFDLRPSIIPHSPAAG